MIASIRTRLLLAFGAVLVATTILGVVSWWSLGSLSGQLEGMYENNLRATAYLSDTERALWELRFGLPNYLTGDLESRAALKDRGVKWMQQLEGNLEAFARIEEHDDDRALHAELKRELAEYLAARPQYFELVDAGKLEEAKQFRATRTNPPAARTVAALGKLIEAQRRHGERTQRAAAAEAARARGTLVVLLAFTVIAGLVFSLAISRTITVPIGRLVKAAQQIARGDLRVELEVRRRDELALLADAFSRMAGQLGGIITEVRAAATGIGSASQEILAGARQHEQGASEQASAVEQTRRTTETLLHSAREIAESSQQVLQNADETNRNNQAIAEAISKLAAQTDRISEILEFIKGVANKSELLALNAALEGTKAGEAGRGFSLVAAQMQRLAEQVMSSAKDIAAMTGSIRQSMSAAVLTTEEGAKVAAATARSARQIRLIVQQQQSGTEQVSQAMQNVTQVAQQTAAGSRQAVRAVDELTDRAAQLTARVSQFQT